MRRYRLAYLVTHPIQYQAPLLRLIAEQPDIDFKAFFYSDMSVGAYVDREFGRTVEWDVPLLEGYDHEFLPAIGRRDRFDAVRPFSYGLARRLREGKFDALWIHGYARVPHLLAMATAKRLGIRVFLRDEASAISARRGPLKSAIKKAYLGWVLNRTDAALAIGDLNRRYYLDYGFPNDRIFSVPYAIDNDFFRDKAEAAARDRPKLRQELDLADDRPVILYCSKLTQRKHPDTLLEAFATVRANPASRKPYLVFVGDGELRQALVSKAQELGVADDIRMAGFQNQTDLPKYYDLCDVFVLASSLEPWGLVINEVMNAGRAAIASPEVGSAANLIDDGANGRIVPPENTGALANALLDVLSDPQKCAEMGRRSLEIIRRWGFPEDVDGIRAALEATVPVRAPA